MSPSIITGNGWRRIRQIISSGGKSRSSIPSRELSKNARLDRGEGKNLSLPECSREQLEKEVSFAKINASKAGC